MKPTLKSLGMDGEATVEFAIQLSHHPDAAHPWVAELPSTLDWAKGPTPYDAVVNLIGTIRDQYHMDMMRVDKLGPEMKRCHGIRSRWILPDREDD